MPGQQNAVRLQSLDLFRGFVIAAMIYVNWASGVEGVPRWLKHAAADENWYSFADLVFPAFLFIVGVAIPFSIGRRMQAGDSPAVLWRRILPRVASLLFLGVVAVSSESYTAEASGIGHAWWALLFYIPVYILWSGLRLPRWARPLAWLVLAIALALFRRKGENGETTWLVTSWWGILGIIGWAYLAAVAAWLGTRGQSLKLSGVLAFMLALYEMSTHGWLDFLSPLTDFISIGGLFGSHAAMVVAGCLAGIQLQKHGGAAWKQTLGLGLACLAGGYLFNSIEIFSKIQGTNAWALASVGWTAIALAGFVWVVEVKNFGKGLAWLGPTGMNPLFAYLLPDVTAALFNVVESFGLNLWAIFWPSWKGVTGMLCAAFWVALMMAITSLATKKGWILKM